MRVFVAAIVLVGICVLLMSVGILMRRGFPKYDIGGNEEMRKRGIVCFKDEDAALHRPASCSGRYTSACNDCALGPSSGKRLRSLGEALPRKKSRCVASRTPDSANLIAD